MKLIIISLLFFSVVFLSGCSLSNKQSSQNLLKTNDTKETTVTSEKTENQKVSDVKWGEIKNSKKLQQCYQSKKDFDLKKNELLPRYKEVLNKETASKKLTTEDEFIKIIYGWIDARGSDYGVFENIINSNTPNNEEEIIKIQNLLEFIYCPDVNKISTAYPLTPNSCMELLQSWMAPFEVPEPKNYKIVEEYKLALEKYKLAQKDKPESARKCCYGEDKSISCTKLVYWLK